MTLEHTQNQYDTLDMHRRMVADHQRTEAFRRSIMATVQPGDVVLDVGAGSGVLSLFAAQAGAARVYAIERETAAVELAHHLALLNGFGDVVQVIHADVTTIEPPEHVDVVVSEWLGAYGVDENFLPAVVTARDRWLRPGGTTIPGAVTTWLAPIEHPVLADTVSLYSSPYGLDLSPLAEHPLDEPIWLPHGVQQEHLCAEPVAAWTVDPQTVSLEEALQPYAAELSFTLSRGGANGLIAWFSADMPNAEPIRTSPDAPLTHWGHLIFPLATTAKFAVGDTIRIGFHNVPVGSGGSHHIWSHLDGSSPLEVHDTRALERSPLQPPWRVEVGSSPSTENEG